MGKGLGRDLAPAQLGSALFLLWLCHLVKVPLGVHLRLYAFLPSG